MAVQLQWNRHRYRLDLGENGPEQMKLSDLKQLVAETCGAPVSAQKLLHSGATALPAPFPAHRHHGRFARLAVMKDDSALLKAYGVRDGSKIMLLATKPPAPSPGGGPAGAGDREEEAIIRRIDDVVNKAETGVLPKLQEYSKESERFVAYYLAEGGDREPSAAYASALKKVTDLRLWITEMAMRALLHLDAIECPREFDAARERRKEGVNRLQGILDRTDSIRDRLQEAQKGGTRP
ncbi:MAG: hypothetical protein BJ554DRAFT_7043 [Olpidium bornovanus]|uniref:BAG domain-containing protein n=1 Tax=Olpidium bornovanus TaxID=278681 RepID=A0A8H7ZWR0_9FUNG|nr:MAG: hypothetical protein BJ554DRAFT_7043 [Olpidium bornovanus]